MSGSQLYRRILRLHRQLPSDIRGLGNSYVREEFIKLRSSSAPQHFEGQFCRAWSEYCSVLELQIAMRGKVEGQQLSKQTLATLSEEQLKQLSLLKRESTRPLKGNNKKD